MGRSHAEMDGVAISAGHGEAADAGDMTSLDLKYRLPDKAWL